jgi:hypothetical protein
MRRRLYRRTGSLLALFAMLVITFAPMVTQLIAADSHAAPLCAAHAAANHQSASHETLAHIDGQACGYCHFFAHAPGITGARTPGVLDVPSSEEAFFAAARDDRPALSFSSAQPRAPPATLS